VTLRLIVFDIDEDTGAKSIKDIKEQDVYMGDMPLMTDNGTFIVNGTERVIVSQMHRSPGVFFDHDKGKSHSSGKLLFAARVIPYRGSWLDIEFDAKDIVHARIDRRRKIPVSSLLMALGMDAEEILSTFYTHRSTARDGDGWRMPFQPRPSRARRRRRHDRRRQRRGRRRSRQEAHPALLKQLTEKGVKSIKATDEDLFGMYLAEDIVNLETGEVYLEAGDEIDEKLTNWCSAEAGHDEIQGARHRSHQCRRLHPQHAGSRQEQSRQDALFDIYRVMRPGEPPTMDSAEAMFQSLFFDSERYDLSAVGRVKMNMRLDLDAEDTVRVLRKEDILAVVKTLVSIA
jgi:DNA-directed RNA polymerase subunit beta